MRFAFRTDASLQIGSGHVMRCLTLADALREQGADCQFICREHEGHMMSLIEQRGYPVKRLPAPSNTFISTAEPAHATWLGCDWGLDAEQTHQAIGVNAVDGLIVDHYALDHRWHQALRRSTKHLMVIDDLADRALACDVLLDQNYGSSSTRYSGLVPKHCLQLHGPEYALLKPVYAEWRAKMRRRSGTIQRVLIYFGGGWDRADLTGQAARAFDAPELINIRLDIVVSEVYVHLSSLKNFAAYRGNVHLHSKLLDLAELMANADLAIGACGATSWERCCMSLPTIMVALADNQRFIAERLSHLNAGMLVESKQIKSDLRELLGQLLNKQKLVSKFGENAGRVCDGEGTRRVVAELVNIA